MRTLIIIKYAVVFNKDVNDIMHRLHGDDNVVSSRLNSKLH